MENQRFFVPVKSESLAHYFARGVILPSSFYTNRPTDVQDHFKNSILLSKYFWITGSDCSVEVYLTESELASINNDDRFNNILLYIGAIPISRVKGVHFKSKEQSETTQWNINNGTAFLPSRLIVIHSTDEAEHELTALTEIASSADDFAEKIRRFDILLGSVAFLNVAKANNAPFAKDYFAVVGYFNTFIKGEFLARVNAGVATYDDRLTGLYKRENGWRDIIPVVTEAVDFEIVETAAKNSNINLEKKYGLIDLSRIPKNSHVYILALLATYGEDKQKGIPDLVGSIIANERDEEKAEEIAAIFGLHLRYSRLRNSYKAKSLVQTKFSLETRLDYYVIESIFQFAFNSRVSANFDYIDKIVPLSKMSNDSSLNVYRILDVAVPIQRVKTPEKVVMDNTKSIGNDERLISEALKFASVRMQENNLKVLDDIIRTLTKELNHKYQSEITGYSRRISELEAKLSQNPPRPVGTEKAASDAVSDKSSANLEELENMEFVDLKKKARLLKVPKKTLDAIKPTKKGINHLIELINSQKPLLPQ